MCNSGGERLTARHVIDWAARATARGAGNTLMQHIGTLGHATLAYGLEHEFNIRFDIDESIALENVREILRIVRSKLDGAS